MPSPFLVNTQTDPVVILIQGRATANTCAPLKTALDDLIGKGRRQFLFDFKGCAGMDSTFLGLVAGVARRLKAAQPTGKVTLNRLEGRNLDNVKSLGLTRLAELTQLDHDHASGVNLPETRLSELETARLVLAAHENLIAVDEANLPKFKDVIALVKEDIARSTPADQAEKD